MKYKNFFRCALYTAIAITTIGCSSDDDSSGDTNETGTDTGSEKIFAVAAGIGTSDSPFIITLADDLMNGTISYRNKGIKQIGFRDFNSAGGNLYSIGGLSARDYVSYTLDEDDQLTENGNLNFGRENFDLFDPIGDGKTLLGISPSRNPTDGTDFQLYTIDIATNSYSKETSVEIRDLYSETEDWIYYTGMQVSGNKLYQTFYPLNAQDFKTTYTDKQFTAIYSYPELLFEKVIEDTRTGPAGTFGTRSGIFKTDNGDLYTISHSSLGYSSASKSAAILRIAAGTTEYDTNYFFETEDVPNGGKIFKAIHIGGDRLFAVLSNQEVADTAKFIDINSRLAIVDLKAQTIKPIPGIPNFTGNGTVRFVAHQDGNDVYTTIKDADGVINIYKVDINTLEATKGAIIDASLAAGIVRLK